MNKWLNLGYIAIFMLLASTLCVAVTTQTAISHHPEALINAAQQTPQAGKKIYTEFCAACHDEEALIPLGAPRIGIIADWKARDKTIDEMMTSVIEGVNAMPARGGCFECTDDLLKAAIHYMVPKHKRDNPE